MKEIPTRGVFNPKIQLALAVGTIFVYGVIVLALWDADWAKLDIALAPLFLLLGLLVGLPVGRRRFRALLEVLPQIEGQFYLSQRAVLSRVRDGENALALERNAWLFAFTVWLIMAGYKKLFYASLVSFILGSYLTGQLLPFIRLWLSLRKET